MQAFIWDEEAMDKGVADSLKHQKMPHDDKDKDPSVGPNQGKKTKRIRTKESESSKKKSTTNEVVMDDAVNPELKMWFVMMINHKMLQNQR
uniref:Uncharacterized protein n=1 Tax=Tanacetum cinerariifolium TaxID=118510 RepID=A0A699QGB2_TANCI|nr:hypothetical protein [Tanacetum cinerariifolium]